MTGRLRRGSGEEALEADEGPFVSFTDLFIGILFLFLILVAALMLMHQEAVQTAEAETLAYEEQVKRMSAQTEQMQVKINAAARVDADHPPFRLAIVFNIYQKEAGYYRSDWTFSRTVQVFRAPNGLCLENVILRNNLNLSWKPSVEVQNIPTAADRDYIRRIKPCTLSASGERWDLKSETGQLQRTSTNLYSGFAILHKKDGDERLDMQYRILGVYDDFYRRPGA